MRNYGNKVTINSTLFLWQNSLKKNRAKNRRPIFFQAVSKTIFFFYLQSIVWGINRSAFSNPAMMPMNYDVFHLFMIQHRTCITSSECSSRGGTTQGSCAAGFGVCCICKCLFVCLEIIHNLFLLF